MATPIPEPGIVRRRVQHPVSDKQMVKKADALKTDVNAIMHRWINKGIPPSGASSHATYGDFTNVESYHAGLNAVRQAEESFMALPAHIRKHVQNDPGQFLEMVYDPERRGELEDLGLLPEQAPEDAPPPALPPPEEPPAE